MKPSALSRLLPFLLGGVALVFASACGRDGAEEPAVVGTELPLYFAASEGDALVVASVTPSSGTVTAFGPKLPSVDKHTHTIRQVVPSRDRRRVLVDVEPIDPSSGASWFLFASDGVSWHVVEESKTGAISASPSRDLSAVWVNRNCSPDAFTSVRPELVTWEGKRLFEVPSCVDYRSAPLFADFTADGGVVTLEGRTEVVVRSPDGASTRLIKRYAAPALDASGNVADVEHATSIRRVFETSLLVATGGALEWIDFDGNHIDVPGFSGTPSCTSYSADYHVTGGQLFEIHDKKLVPIQKLPASAHASEVDGHTPNYAVVSDGKFGLVDADGSLRASYEPDGPGTASSFPFPPVLLGPYRWAVVHVEFHGQNEGDYIPMTGYGEDLVVFGADATSISGTPIRRIKGSPPLSREPSSHVFQASTTGAYLVYTNDTTFHRIDIATKSDVVLTTTLEPLLADRGEQSTWIAPPR